MVFVLNKNLGYKGRKIVSVAKRAMCGLASIEMACRKISKKRECQLMKPALLL